MIEYMIECDLELSPYLLTYMNSTPQFNGK